VREFTTGEADPTESDAKTKLNEAYEADREEKDDKQDADEMDQSTQEQQASFVLDEDLESTNSNADESLRSHFGGELFQSVFLGIRPWPKRKGMHNSEKSSWSARGEGRGKAGGLLRAAPPPGFSFFC
jgi:hypothetical protein